MARLARQTVVNNVKPLIVVLLIAWLVFRLAKSIFTQFSTERDFCRRRNVWFVLTVTGFLSPSFWLFSLIALPLLARASRKDANPVAVYLMMLHVIPPITVDLPVIGINRLFSLDMYRLLSFSVLLPVVWRMRTSQLQEKSQRFLAMDILLLAYGALQIVLFVRPDTPDAAFLHDSATNMLRRSALFFLDVFLPYFVVSRTRLDKRSLVDAMGAFCLVLLVMAPLAAFESIRHWLLYAELGKNWGGALFQQYLERSQVLRSTVSTGHSLALGYLFAIAMGFWLYLSSQVKPSFARFGVAGILLIGLLAAYSRGPWAGAIVIYFAFTALGPRGIPRLLKACVVFALSMCVILVSPLGNRIVAVIPFLGGTVDSGNVDYRQRLLHRSLDIVLQNPFFGDQDAYSKLQDMRQGVGVIDFVNVYANVAVFYGLIGLFLFVGFILIGLIKAFRRAKNIRLGDSDFSQLGACLCACILGTLVMLCTASFLFGYEKMFYVLAGLAAAYAKNDALNPQKVIQTETT